jgi:hypothetical protein
LAWTCDCSTASEHKGQAEHSGSSLHPSFAAALRIRAVLCSYKELFKFEHRPDVSIAEDFFSMEEVLTDEERDRLENRFTEEEISKAVFESYLEGAPGPDGISFLFYKKMGCD